MRHAVDIEIGSRIKNYRLNHGMSQTDLAKAIGVSFQQVQKYESAQNRVSASRLVLIAHAVNAHPAEFFAGMGVGE